MRSSFLPPLSLGLCISHPFISHRRLGGEEAQVRCGVWDSQPSGTGSSLKTLSGCR